MYVLARTRRAAVMASRERTRGQKKSRYANPRSVGQGSQQEPMLCNVGAEELMVVVVVVIGSIG